MKKQKPGLIFTEEELDHLLDRWRAWSRDQHNLGFKTRTTEHRLMREGANLKSYGANVTEDPACEVLDAVISAMPEKMHKAIKIKYLFGFRNKESAQKLGMTYSSYKIFLVRCRTWLCARLSP